MLERIYRRRIPADRFITPEFARTLTEISFDLGKQLGVIVSRNGTVTHVIAGDARGVFIPDLADYPIGKKPLRGLRFIHTHIGNEPLSNEDLADLSLLRFDMIAALTVRDGLPDIIHTASLMPYGSEQKIETESVSFHRFDLDFRDFVISREQEMERSRVMDLREDGESAILVGVSTRPRFEIEDSMEELKELAVSAGVTILDTIVQRLKDFNPKYLMGEGKLKELIIRAMDKGATMIIFDQELTPSQARAIAETTELKVIDRSQLILDLFARRAHTRDGKVQVELAQLQYTLPRLTGKGTAMSRLMGGIGGRGPGEMKLEVDRRRIRERITHLELELKKLGLARLQRKQRRVERSIPIVSIIGYANAGKSTLLNSLTNSATLVEDRMFATLDTASRRLRFPREREIIVTDTVGFIRDLPDDLAAAFRSTLEELDDADLLIHLVDISNPRYEYHIESVEAILHELSLDAKDRCIVFNKIDRMNGANLSGIPARYNAIGISAIDPSSFGPLLGEIERRIWENKTHSRPA